MILPGLRVDHFQRIDETAVQPRLTARWTLGPQVMAKGGVGLFMQEPQLDETNEDFGNPDLEAERALHTSAGVEYKPTSWLTLDLTGFYKNLWHLVSPTDATVMDGDVMEPLQLDNGGDRRRLRRRADRPPRLQRQPERLAHLHGVARRAPRHRRDRGATVRLRPDPHRQPGRELRPPAQLDGERTLPPGQRQPEHARGRLGLQRDRATSTDRSTATSNSARDRAFQQLDLRIDKRWIYQSWIFGAYLDIQNVYNYENSEGLSYNFDYSETDSQTGLPLLTIFGLKAEF